MRLIKPGCSLCHRCSLLDQFLLRLLEKLRSTLVRATVRPDALTQLRKVADRVEQSSILIGLALLDCPVFAKNRLKLAHQVIIHLLFHRVADRTVLTLVWSHLNVFAASVHIASL